MQGHNDVLAFKAFICHDGILDTKNAYFGTEEIYFAVSQSDYSPSLGVARSYIFAQIGT